MGTHPIFESDFDCLTERNRKGIDIANLKIPINPILPIPPLRMKNCFYFILLIASTMALPSLADWNLFDIQDSRFMPEDDYDHVIGKRSADPFWSEEDDLGLLNV